MLADQGTAGFGRPVKRRTAAAPHPNSGSRVGAASCATSHVMLLLEPPRLAAVVRRLAAPDEGIEFDVVERPAQVGTVVVMTAQHDAIPFGSPFHPDGRGEGGRRKHYGP